MAKCPKCSRVIPDTGGICPFCGNRIRSQERRVNSIFAKSSPDAVKKEESLPETSALKKPELSDSRTGEESAIKKSGAEEEKSILPKSEKEDRREESQALPPPPEKSGSLNGTESKAPGSSPESLPRTETAEEESKASKEPDTPDSEEDEYYFDTNSDGYYDDVLPIMAEQINRLPAENVLRIVLTIAFALIIVILCLLNI